MITIDPTYVCDIPVSREQVGFPKEGDRGNAVLLLADDMKPHTRAAYQQAGYVHEGIRIASCCEEVCAVLEQLQLRYCPWPDRGFTLAVLDHALMSMVADRIVVSWLTADDAQQEGHSDEKEA
jgi:hypothetical protein